MPSLRPLPALRREDRALLDPRHHVAEFCADLLDQVLRELGAAEPLVSSVQTKDFVNLQFNRNNDSGPLAPKQQAAHAYLAFGPTI
jgi:hypothetical protein